MLEYNVKVYTYIDNLNHLIEPVSIFGDKTQSEIEIVSRLFKENGWEGDGQIKLIWVPPFLFRGWNTEGKYVWHVKQSNNGISFLAFKGDFPFISDDMQPIDFKNTVYNNSIEVFKEFLNESKMNLSKIKTLNDQELVSLIIKGLHADIISSFNEFFNNVSLDVFHEIVMYNNPYKLKLNYKPKLTLSLKTITSASDDFPDGTYDEYFFFNVSAIQSLYDNFKFEPYDERIKVICDCFDFDMTPFRSIFKKHVEIRNAIQHREGMLDAKSYNSIGEKVYIMQDDNTEKEYRAYEEIMMTCAEIDFLLNKLIEFADSMKYAIKSKMGSKVF